MNRLRKIWLTLFPRYRSLEIQVMSYADADKLIRANEGKPESEQWDICPRLEDGNICIGMVWLERKERITA